MRCFVFTERCIYSQQETELHVFFFQAEDGIRDAQESRGLGDVYKRQLYAFYDSWFILPGFGLLVGWATNYIALLLIFNPIEPKKVCCFTVHGAFLKRQDEVSVEYAKLSTENFLKAEYLFEEILEGPKRQVFKRLFVQAVGRHVDSVLGFGGKMGVRVLLGPRKFSAVKLAIAEEALMALPQLMTCCFDYVDSALNIEPTMREKLAQLPPAEFERVLHPVFEADEAKLIAVGAVLGMAVGFAQQFLIFEQIG
eukprot:TRINITY_DN54850_c0_g1_i1.p1 TRINITY_DN54850_c0_g1~~TRINITY_DN54850_c0_g1_i1.p1  ORF type:complete len:253 (+),score=76.00 TRINITY_DN54850_c0_g1_i1:61-819(+)